MASKRTAKRRRTRMFGEENLHAQAMRAGQLPHPDMRPIRSTRGRGPGMTGIDFAVRADMMHVERPGRPCPEEVGATVAALDYRASREKFAGKSAGSSLTATATGGRRLLGY